MVVTRAMFTGRWWLLPFCRVLGASTKESFVPLSTVSVCTWSLNPAAAIFLAGQTRAAERRGGDGMHRAEEHTPC